MALSDAQKKQVEVALGSKKADGVPSPAGKAIAGAAKMMDVAVIADAASATAEDCANKINEMLAAVKNG